MEETDSQPAELPSGTVTFLFTDIEGSTRLERELRERYGDVLAEHQQILRSAFERHHGREIDTQGDSFFAVFPRARDAVAAAVEIQGALASQQWPDGQRVRVRIGMHTGEASPAGDRYVGLAVHRAARISAAGHGGQILLSGSTRDVVEDDLPSGLQLRDLGEHRLKDLPRPERVFQLLVAGLDTDFPRLKALEEQADLVPATAPPWWRQAKVLGPLAALVAAVVVAGALLLPGGDEAGAASLSANALGLIDAESGSIDEEIPVDAAPTGVALGEGAVWVTNASDGTVSRIDPAERTVRQTIDVGDSPSGIAVGGGAVWVVNHADGTVSRISPETNAVVQTIAVGSSPIAVAFGEGSVWVTNSEDRTVSRIDPESGDVVGTIETDAIGRGIVVGGGSVWVTDESSRRVMRLDPATDEVEEVSVGNGPTGIAFGARTVWVTNSIDGTVSRIDAGEARVSDTIPVAGGPGAVAVSGGLVWVSVEFAERLVRIDPARGEVVDAVAIGNRPKGLVVTDNAVWVAVQASGRGHRGGRLIVQSEPLGSIDPGVANDPSTVMALGLVYDGLLAYRRVGGSEGTQLVPDLAVSIPRPRDGGKTYTFRLRSGMRYADRELVRAVDFRRALERMLRLGEGVAAQGTFSSVLGAEKCAKGRACDLSEGVVTKGQTITFHLREPDPFFLANVATALIPTPAATPAADVGTKPFPGTGPYRIESYVPDRQLTIVRNPNFRVWSQVARPDGYADEIVFRFGDAAPALTAVLRGRGDVFLHGIAAERLAELAAQHPRQLYEVPERATVFLFLDTTQPPFDDVRVRRALNYAVDRRHVAGLGGPALAQPTCQVIPPTVPGYVRHCPYTLDPDLSGEWTAPDLAKARRLIAASGTKGQEVTVWTFSYFGKEGRYAVSLLRALGYRAQLMEVKALTRYFTIIADPKTRAQSGIAGWYAVSSGYGVLTGLTCGDGGNWARFCDRDVDRRLRASLQLVATDPGAASRIWAELDRELVDQAPWVPLFTPRSPYLVSKRLGNWQYHPYQFVLLDQLWVR